MFRKVVRVLAASICTAAVWVGSAQGIPKASGGNYPPSVDTLYLHNAGALPSLGDTDISTGPLPAVEPIPLPLPPAAILFASALAGLGLLTVRRRRRSHERSLPR